MSCSFLLDEATVASGKFTAPGASPALTGQEQQGGCAQLIRERWTMQEKDGRVQAMARQSGQDSTFGLARGQSHSMGALASERWLGEESRHVVLPRKSPPAWLCRGKMWRLKSRVCRWAARIFLNRGPKHCPVGALGKSRHAACPRRYRGISAGTVCLARICELMLLLMLMLVCGAGLWELAAFAALGALLDQ